jgi:Zn-dependent alcohol dehydrogenase
MKTEALIYIKKGQPLKIENIVLPKPKGDEVIVKIVATGICHSQLINLSRQPRSPELLGHEATGILVDKGKSVRHVKIGDKVLISWMPDYSNKKIEKNYFKPVEVIYKNSSLQAFIFTWAKDTLINSQFVTKLPNGIDMYNAAVLGCAGIAGYGTVYNTVNIKKNQSVIVVGAGGLGVLAINAAKNLGAKPIIAIDLEQKKLNFSKKFGADFAIKYDIHLDKKISKILKNGADYVFDMVGKNTTLEKSISLTKSCVPGSSSGGSTVIVGFPSEKMLLDTKSILMSEKKIIGSRGGSCIPQRDFKNFYRDCRSGKIKLNDAITKVYKLSEINKALKDLSEGKILGRSIIKIQ